MAQPTPSGVLAGRLQCSPVPALLTGHANLSAEITRQGSLGDSVGELGTVMLKVQSRVPKDGGQRHVRPEVRMTRGWVVTSSKPAARRSTRLWSKKCTMNPPYSTMSSVGIGSGASCVNHRPAGAQHAAMLAGEELEHAVMPSGRECLSGNERRGRCHTCRDWRRTWRPSAPSVW